MMENQEGIMPNPNIPLDKLRAVSKTMAKILELRIRAFENGCKSIGVDYYDVDTIAADLLRLAEENEALRKRLEEAVRKGFDMGKFLGSCETSKRFKERDGRSEPH